MTKLSSLALLALILSSCGPKFKPHYDPDANWFGHLESVPIIALVKIEPDAVTFIGKPFTDDAVPFPLELFKTNILVENVLKGDLRLGPTEFFYISAASSVGPPKLGFYGIIPVRALLLLRREKGVLRTIEDVSRDDYAQVSSGSHLNFKPKPGAPLAHTLIDLLLTRGEGATDAGMAKAITGQWAPRISPQYTAETAFHLANSELPLIRVAACLEFRDVLAGNLVYSEKEAVKRQLAQQFGIPESVRAKWTKLFDQNGSARVWWQDRLEDRFSKPPVVTTAATHLKGLDLCMNDAALGVPPLHN